jgi:hypothetical protein
MDAACSRGYLWDSRDVGALAGISSLLIAAFGLAGAILSIYFRAAAQCCFAMLYVMHK